MLFFSVRSIQRRGSIRKAVLGNFAIFTGKQLCWSLFLIMVQAVRPATILKRDSNTSVSLWILQNFQEHLFWRASASVYICSVCVVTSIGFVLLVFSIFPLRNFLFLNVTYAKILAKYEIFVIFYFVTFSSANILHSSCQFPRTTERFEDELFIHTTFSFLINLETGAFSKITFSSGDSSPMLTSCRKTYYFVKCTSIIVLQISSKWL